MTRLLFLLSILKGERVENIDIDIKALINTRKDKKSRTLFPLLYHELKNHNYPAVPETLRSAFYSALAYSALLEKAHRDLDELLKSNNITYMDYKGMAIESKYYEQTGTRPMRDIDILIQPEDMKNTRALLTDNGYKFTWSCNYHAQFMKDDIFYEIHTALFSYKYLIFFDLGNIDYNSLFTEKEISSELYLLLSTLQHYDEMGARCIPFVDIINIINTGIDLEKWHNLVSGCSAGFPVMFCHYYMLQRLGYSPFQNMLLETLEITEKYKHEIIRLAGSAEKRMKTYYTVFRMAPAMFGKIYKILFPPPSVYRHYSFGIKFPRLHHLIRVFSQLAGLGLRPRNRNFLFRKK